jgi:predicted small lipoprotein YifL
VNIRRYTTSSAAVLLIVLSAACGKKGPPLEPLRLIPASVADLSARRSGREVELRFVLPTANANGAGTIDLDRVEVYAITIGPGSVTPPNRDLLTKARVAGTISIKPAPVDGAPEPEATDKRPAPGHRITFVEQLSDDKLVPVPSATPKASTQKEVPGAQKEVASPDSRVPGAQKDVPSPESRAASPDVAQPAAAAVPAGPTEPTRIYVVRGLSRAGRPGPPSSRVLVPLVSPVLPPSSVVAQMPNERTIAVEWTPPVAEAGGSPFGYNVYRPDVPGAPLNQAPVTEIKFETAAGEFGKEQCFVVRTIQTLQNVTIESETSAPACLTPVDTFAPAAPKELRAVAEDGAINLVWDPSSEADLGGYLILRGEAPGETLQPLTPKPIAEANYRDTTVTPGVRYVYAVVAVDRATPRNSSVPSASEAVTAR